MGALAAGLQAGSSILGSALGFIGAGRAGKDIATAAQAAEQGLLGASANATGAVTDTLDRNSNAVINAQGQAIGNVSQYGNYATNLLGGNQDIATGNINPFIANGQAGNTALANYAGNLPQFGMSPYSTAPQFGGIPQFGSGTPAGAMPPAGDGRMASQMRGGPVGPQAGFGGQPGGPPQFTMGPGSGFEGRPGQFNFAPTMDQLSATPGYQFAKQEGLNAIQNSASANGLGQSSNQNLDAGKFATGLASQTYQNAFQNAAQSFGMNQNAFNQTYQNALQGFGANVGAYNSAFNNSLNQFNTNQGLRLNTLGSLQGAGLTGTGQANQALLGFGVPAATDIYNTGMFGGNTINSNALFNAQQGLQSTEFGSNIVVPAAEQAGNFALEGAGANAAGVLGQYNNLASGGASVLNSIPGLFGLKP